MYKVKDSNNGRYVGITAYKKGLTLQENLDRRMRSHLDRNKEQSKLSAVLEMTNPVIYPFYGRMNDKNPYFIYGKRHDCLSIEKQHIRKTMFDCMANNTICFNKQQTKLKPEIDEQKVNEYNIVDQQIQKLLDEFVIKSSSGRYVVMSQSLATVLNYKSNKIRKTDKSKLVELVHKGIAKMCKIDVKRVKNVIKNKIYV